MINKCATAPSMSSTRSVIQQQGFTLIEVMVALMILAVVAVTAGQVSSGYIGTVEGMKTRTLANFVAQNMAHELQINKKPVTMTSTRVSQQGRTWQVNYSSKPITLSTGSVLENVTSVNINVAEVVDTASSSTGLGANVTVFIQQ